VDGHYRINEVVPRHFLQAAKAAGFGVALAEEVLAEVAGRVEGALEETAARMPQNFPEDLVQTIAQGVKQRAKSLQIENGLDAE
jgi:serine/threonine-protein kinase HipA